MSAPENLDAVLEARLAELRQRGIYRELRRVDSAQGTRVRQDGQGLLNFSSNDYLGLANEPSVREAAIRASERFGAGAGSARLICGSQAPHHELEQAIAELKGAAAALSFSSGYAAAMGAIGALVRAQDVIILDRLAHACIVDAARLSGAKLRVCAHNDLEDLENKLRWAAGRVPRPRVLVVTESVFSMDGDRAALPEIVALKEQYGAWLMVDEAHATGLYGEGRRGLIEETGVTGRVEIQMGTLGKALGSAGGFICGSRALVDYLVNSARTFIFSTAPVPAAAAAALAGVRFVQSPAGEDRRQRLWQRVAELQAGLGLPPQHRGSAIMPLRVGDEALAMRSAAALRGRGILMPAIRYPTVARGQARLRLTLTANHTREEVSQLVAALGALELPSVRPPTPPVDHVPNH